MKKLNHIICIGLFLGLTIIAILTLLQRAEAQQQNAGFLYPPYFGTSYISSVFDHEYPLYHREIRFPDDNNLVITSTIRHNDGISYTNNIPGYSGHDGIDYGLRYEYVLASHAGRVLEAGWDSPAHPANPACQLPANQNGQESNLAGEYWYGVSG